MIAAIESTARSLHGSRPKIQMASKPVSQYQESQLMLISFAMEWPSL